MKKGDWIYSSGLQKAGLVREVIDDFVIVAFPAPPIQYALGGNTISRRFRTVEVLRMKGEAVKPLSGFIPLGNGINAVIERAWVDVFGSDERKAALKAYREAKSIIDEIRAAL